MKAFIQNRLYLKGRLTHAVSKYPIIYWVRHFGSRLGLYHQLGKNCSRLLVFIIETMFVGKNHSLASLPFLKLQKMLNISRFDLHCLLIKR